MNPRSWLLALITSVLCGCASTRFQATWYFGRDGDNDYQVFVTLLNQGPGEQQVREVILNPAGDAKESGYRLGGLERRMAPGAVLILRTAKFNSGAQAFPPCHVPISVLVVAGPEKNRVQKVVARMIVSPPGSVPHGWEAKCAETAENE